MPAYFSLDMLEVTDPAALETYRQVVFATVQRYGGRYLTVGGKSDVAEGTWRPTFAVLIEFPSLDHAKRWYGSDEYRAPKAMRLARQEATASSSKGRRPAPET